MTARTARRLLWAFTAAWCLLVWAFAATGTAFSWWSPLPVAAATLIVDRSLRREDRHDG